MNFFAYILVILGASSALAQNGAPVVINGEIIVKLKAPKLSQNGFAFMGKAISAKGMALKTSWDGMNMHHFKVRPGDDMWARIEELKNDPEVEYAEPNYQVSIHQTVVNEVEGLVESQQDADMRAMAAGSNDYGLSTAPIRAAEAWGIATNDPRTITVAVVDSGVDYNHQVFANSGAIWTNTNETLNGVDDDGNGFVDDIRGWNFLAGTNNPMDDGNHGTHVAGIILGVTQDIFATPISSAKIKIMPLKFLNSSGSGTISAAVSAMYYAVNNGAKVINNSWGGSSMSYSLQDAVKYAYDNKVVVVAAAGNSAINVDASPVYPASFNSPGLIAVGSTTSSDTWSPFSNYGLSSIPLAAPGSSVYSTLPNGTYGIMSGTSMATPFVSGMAAMMLREQPTLNAYQIRTIAAADVDVVASLSNRVGSSGRIDVYSSVWTAKGSVGSFSQPSYQLTNTGSDRTSSSSSSGQPAVGGCGLVQSINDKEVPPGAGLILVVMFAPLALYFFLRRATTQERRLHTRFMVDSQVRISVGDRELVGQMTSLSMGGLQLNADAWLANGGVVNLQITSPDGKQTIEVAGQIVWSEKEKRYGVKFTQLESAMQENLSGWFKKLKVQPF